MCYGGWLSEKQVVDQTSGNKLKRWLQSVLKLYFAETYLGFYETDLHH